jgi:hypothetical protein
VVNKITVIEKVIVIKYHTSCSDNPKNKIKIHDSETPINNVNKIFYILVPHCWLIASLYYMVIIYSTNGGLIERLISYVISILCMSALMDEWLDSLIQLLVFNFVCPCSPSTSLLVLI